MSTFKVIEGSESYHCCFEYSIIKSGEEDAVCECFEEKHANLICNALNEYFDDKLQEGKIDYHVHQIAEYIKASGLNFKGAEFESEDGEKFTVTVANENWAQTLKEQNRMLNGVLMKVYNQISKRAHERHVLEVDDVQWLYNLITKDEL